MTKKTAANDSFSGKKSKLYKEISNLKESVSDYKTERKASWKVFKNETKSNIEKIEKSLNTLITGFKKK